MKYINLWTVVMILCSAVAAMGGGYYFQKPDLLDMPDNARVLVYDANTNTDKNVTGGFLKGYFSLNGHKHVFGNISGLQSALDGKSNVGHGHTIPYITGLQAILDGKVDLTDYRLSNARAPLPHSQTASTITDFVQAAAAASPVQSVAGKIGAVTLTPLDVGLEETCTGRVSTDGIDGSFIYTGSTAPAADLGVERDFYLQSNGDYYRKEGAPPTWVLKGSLLGPASTVPGPPGPANALTIGTVTAGAPGTAAAAITGTPPSQVLSLTIPKGDPGPANTLAIGTVTTGNAGTAAAATITGAAPSYTLSLTIPKGDPGDPGTINRDQILTQLEVASDTIVYLQPATNSPTAGGLVINDYLGNAAVILRTGSVEVRDTAGVPLAKIDRAAGSVATYDTSGNVVVKHDRTGLYGLYADGSTGFSWSRSSRAVVIQ